MLTLRLVVTVAVAGWTLVAPTEVDGSAKGETLLASSAQVWAMDAWTDVLQSLANPLCSEDDLAEALARAVG